MGSEEAQRPHPLHCASEVRHSRTMQLIAKITYWESNPLIEEVLSKTNDPKTPLEELEYYQLNLLEEANDLGTRHVVKQWHGAWSEIDRQIMWDREEVE